MCGILGGCVDARLSKDWPSWNLALKLIAHRGPNDSGIEFYPLLSSANVVLGHTRLSIIDLSDAGHQPMISKDKRFALVFNGEIYNYKELREELKRLGRVFSSDTDTEVLLASWEEWGELCLKRLTGMFSFVIYDNKEGLLFCARDAFGIKPFFYSTNSHEGFLFASELPALLRLKSDKPELNWQTAYDYLVYGDYDDVEDTFINNIKHLRPGHLLRYNLSTLKIDSIEQWWVPKITPVSTLSFKDAAERLRDLFLKNVKLHLRSDVPLGAALSGGIDSSAVVCAMRLVEPDLPINTFSFIAQGSQCSEEKWIDIVNEQVGATPHKIVVTAQDIAKDIDDMICAQGEPFGSTSIYAQYRVFKLAKDFGITVTLDGQGADELLAGYSGFPGRRMMSLLQEGRPFDILRFSSAWSKWPNRSYHTAWMMFAAELLPKSMHKFFRVLIGKDSNAKWLKKNLLQEGGVKLIPKSRFPFDLRGRLVVAQLAASLHHRNLPALLRHADRSSMRFSIESRVPFLTTELADFTLSLPEEYLVSNKGETKSIFRAAMRGIVPDIILDRRDKIGFETPEKEWFLSMREDLLKIVQDADVPAFIDKKELLIELSLVLSGKKPFSWQVWRWINFIKWYKFFVLS